MVSKLRAGNSRQEPEQDAMGDQAVFNLAVSALLGDPEFMGLALVLLAGRNCAATCGSARRRPHSLRDRGYGPIE